MLKVNARGGDKSLESKEYGCASLVAGRDSPAAALAGDVPS